MEVGHVIKFLTVLNVKLILLDNPCIIVVIYIEVLSPCSLERFILPIILVVDQICQVEVNTLCWVIKVFIKVVTNKLVSSFC